MYAISCSDNIFRCGLIFWKRMNVFSSFWEVLWVSGSSYSNREAEEWSSLEDFLVLKVLATQLPWKIKSPSKKLGTFWNFLKHFLGGNIPSLKSSNLQYLFQTPKTRWDRSKRNGTLNYIQGVVAKIMDWKGDVNTGQSVSPLKVFGVLQRDWGYL